MTCKSTPATKMARLSAAAVGILLLAAAHAIRAADGDFEAAPAVATASTSVVTASAGVPGQVRAQAARYRLADESPGLGSPVDASLSDLPARFCYVFVQENQREVFLRNSDPLVRAKLRVSLGREWLFVYADMGGGSSALRWQSLVGIRVGQDAHLLAGWRGMTYYLSPGGDFNSLDADGPFIGAQRAW